MYDTLPQVTHDPHRGPLVYLRVYAGTLQKKVS